MERTIRDIILGKKFDIIYDNDESIILNLEFGMDPDIKNEHGDTILGKIVGHYTRFREEIVALLLYYGANVNLRVDERGMTALMYASQSGRDKIARLLLDRGADPNIQSNRGYTALTFPSYDGNEEIVRMLLESRADPNIRDYKGKQH